MQNYIGQNIDRYRIIAQQGMGGMAVVYKAYDTRLERDVALKLIRTEAIPAEQHKRLLKRFEREAKAQARFSHPNIISVHDYGEVNGSPFLVMEFIPGGTLKIRLKGPVAYRQAIQWLVPIVDALEYAHKRGVIHRDIKPSNILFDEADRPILTDFGIAKLLETDDATLTGTGLGVGTPEYMAPEQWRGQASPATDQYALGVVLYELLTGQKPYSADTPAAVAIMQATEPLRKPSTLNADIPESVEKMLFKALANNPQDRYKDMDAFRKALEGQLILESAQAVELEEATLPEPDNVSEESDPMRRSEAETVDVLEYETDVEPGHPKQGAQTFQARNESNSTSEIQEFSTAPIEDTSQKSQRGLWQFGKREITLSIVFSIIGVFISVLIYRDDIWLAVSIFSGLAFGPIVGFIVGSAGMTIARLLLYSYVGILLEGFIFGLFGFFMGLLSKKLTRFRSIKSLVLVEFFIIIIPVLIAVLATIYEIFTGGRYIIRNFVSVFEEVLLYGPLQSLILVPIMLVLFELIEEKVFPGLKR